ncbi:hypothetical protein HDU67_007929 [Dinochytrium kinnereticum]|nr:hypothetical protein HDU67_007929 [Dinochytrium kinnereticum]
MTDWESDLNQLDAELASANAKSDPPGTSHQRKVQDPYLRVDKPRRRDADMSDEDYDSNNTLNTLSEIKPLSILQGNQDQIPMECEPTNSESHAGISGSKETDGRVASMDRISGEQKATRDQTAMAEVEVLLSTDSLAPETVTTEDGVDPIIAQLLEHRCIMSDVDEYAEMERRRRMYIMLRYSNQYKRLQVKGANSRWAAAAAGDDILSGRHSTGLCHSDEQSENVFTSAGSNASTSVADFVAVPTLDDENPSMAITASSVPEPSCSPLISAMEDFCGIEGDSSHFPISSSVPCTSSLLGSNTHRQIPGTLAAMASNEVRPPQCQRISQLAVRLHASGSQLMNSSLCERDGHNATDKCSVYSQDTSSLTDMERRKGHRKVSFSNNVTMIRESRRKSSPLALGIIGSPDSFEPSAIDASSSSLSSSLSASMPSPTTTEISTSKSDSVISSASQRSSSNSKTSQKSMPSNAMDLFKSIGRKRSSASSAGLSSSGPNSRQNSTPSPTTSTGSLSRGKESRHSTSSSIFDSFNRRKSTPSGASKDASHSQLQLAATFNATPSNVVPPSGETASQHIRENSHTGTRGNTRRLWWQSGLFKSSAHPEQRRKDDGGLEGSFRVRWRLKGVNKVNKVKQQGEEEPKGKAGGMRV